MRIGFLFNHDQIHQVAHGLPIALALAAMRSGAEIIVCVTNERLAEEVRRLAPGSAGRDFELVQLGLTKPASRSFDRLAHAFIPSAKLLMYKDNLDFFRHLDVLVVPEMTSLILKTRFGLDQLKIIHTRHGAGDRAIGFNRASASFDHVLVSGPKIRQRLIADAGVDPARISVVGYPKFDLCAASRSAHPLIDTGRPVVVYNPHVSPHLSSWYQIGRHILDWFAEHDEYQLIFAPHVMLFERPVAVTIDKFAIGFPGSIDKRHLRAANIHVDLGSRNSTTMAYLNRADIYLGDVSSQIYEYLIRPRPCVFLNSHRFDWQKDANFAMWTAGPVIERASELGPALADAQARHQSTYAPIQQRLFEESFDLTDTPSSIRAAAVVAEIAGVKPKTVRSAPVRTPSGRRTSAAAISEDQRGNA